MKRNCVLFHSIRYYIWAFLVKFFVLGKNKTMLQNYILVSFDAVSYYRFSTRNKTKQIIALFKGLEKIIKIIKTK